MKMVTLDSLRPARTTGLLVYLDKDHKTQDKIRLGDEVRAVFTDADGSGDPCYVDGTVKELSLKKKLVVLSPVTYYNRGGARPENSYRVPLDCRELMHFIILKRALPVQAAA